MQIAQMRYFNFSLKAHLYHQSGRGTPFQSCDRYVYSLYRYTICTISFISIRSTRHSYLRTFQFFIKSTLVSSMQSWSLFRSVTGTSFMDTYIPTYVQFLQCFNVLQTLHQSDTKEYIVEEYLLDM